MLKRTSWRLALLVAGAAVLIVAAGGVSVASNMGFKVCIWPDSIKEKDVKRELSRIKIK